MKNIIFISPNFPTNYWQFCRELKGNGMNVLGIGDQPYDELSQDLKDSLNEYYKVVNLENEDEVYRGIAFWPTSMGGSTGWSPITNTGWSGMQDSARISILLPGSRWRMCPALSINQR